MLDDYDVTAEEIGFGDAVPVLRTRVQVMLLTKPMPMLLTKPMPMLLTKPMLGMELQSSFTRPPLHHLAS